MLGYFRKGFGAIGSPTCMLSPSCQLIHPLPHLGKEEGFVEGKVKLSLIDFL